MKSLAWQYANKTLLIKIMSLSFLQQVAIALSTWALVHAGFSYKEPKALLFWVGIAFGLHLLAPALQILVKGWEYDLSFEAYRGFLEKNLMSKAGNAALWRRKDLKENFTASIGIDAEGYLAAMLFVGLDVFTFLSSLVLGMIVLGTMIDAKFVPAFLISGILSYVCYLKLSKSVKKSYEQEQVSRTAYNGYVLSCWDNVFFNNKRIINNYGANLQSKYEEAKSKTHATAIASELLIFTLGLVSALPVIAVIFWSAAPGGTASTAVLLGLLATIPRQLNMLTTFRSIFQNLAAYLGFEAKFRVIHETAQLAGDDYEKQIQVPKMTLNRNRFASLPEIKKFLESATEGRFEILGENGSGKSTLLIHLNEVLGCSFYLPSHPNLAIHDGETLASSGEKMLQHFEFLKQGNEKYLLLDEWDANLDLNNRDILEKELNELAKTRVVIEVRHRVVG